MSSGVGSAAPRTTPLGPLVRLRALKPKELPAHGKLEAHQNQSGTKTPELAVFIEDVLSEASSFLNGYFAKETAHQQYEKKSLPAALPVEVELYDIKVSDLPWEVRGAMSSDESWLVRTSTHENAAKDRTASWEEFRERLLKESNSHDAHAANRVLDWSPQLTQRMRKIGQWEDVHAGIYKKVRGKEVFPILNINAETASSLVRVQIPVDVSALTSDTHTKTGHRVVVGQIELTDDGKQIRWQKALAKDHKSMMPSKIRIRSESGELVEEVGNFIARCQERRRGNV